MELEILARLPSEKHSSYAYRVLQHNIFNLILEPGTILNEQDLANYLHISRTPIREAISKLEEEKLMEIYPQSGSVVSLIDLDYLSSIGLIRRVVEAEIMRQLCSSIVAENITKLRDNLHMQKSVCAMEHPNLNFFFQLDKSFHRLLYDAAEQQTLAEIMQRTTVYFDRISIFLLKHNYLDINTSYAWHCKWLEIIAEGATNQIGSAIEGHLRTFHNIDSIPEFPQYFTNKLKKRIQYQNSVTF